MFIASETANASFLWSKRDVFQTSDVKSKRKGITDIIEDLPWTNLIKNYFQSQTVQI